MHTHKEYVQWAYMCINIQLTMALLHTFTVYVHVIILWESSQALRKLSEKQCGSFELLTVICQ